MAYQAVFKRYELKFLLNRQQKERIIKEMKPYMSLDQYGRTTIRNLYLDTENYRLVRRSIEKPKYKEKLRIRSYQKATPESKVFVELKKKYDSIVYKRRVALSEEEAMRWMRNKKYTGQETQISKEIDYFLAYYDNLKPVLFLSYEREAYYSNDGGDFRVTFDDTILCRQDQLSLISDVGGDSLLDNDIVLMEIKCSGGIPLWMVSVLSEERIYKTSFSKYGKAYQNIIFPEHKRGGLNERFVI